MDSQAHTWLADPPLCLLTSNLKAASPHGWHFAGFGNSPRAASEAFLGISRLTRESSYFRLAAWPSRWRTAGPLSRACSDESAYGEFSEKP